MRYMHSRLTFQGKDATNQPPKTNKNKTPKTTTTTKKVNSPLENKM